jgi:sulfatase maturation enzyme AslB (radical SAM superfamily)
MEYNISHTLPIKDDYIARLAKVSRNGQQPFSIENGYFIFTMMPSLRCSLSCPHCYLSEYQRRQSPIMSLDNLKIACHKVDEYYQKKQIDNKLMIFYWYGGEPTEMGIDYFNQATSFINQIFSADKGYTTKHTVLTSLLTIDTSIWFPFFRDHCENHFQSSFDGLMRGGKNYVRKWEEKIRQAKDFGLEVGTISVVNHEILKGGARQTMEYLSDLKIKEVSFLPFMWNEQNDGKAYNKFAPSMNAWSDFMIEVSEFYFEKKAKGEHVPEIGQLNFILHQMNQPLMANIAGQTLFLLPEGEFVLPDYKNGYQEYMHEFGNILESSFEEILQGKERRAYLRKQVLRDGNEECLDCEHTDKCVMEFWKKNRQGDDCFGGKRYVEWLLDYVRTHKVQTGELVTY